MPFLPKEDGQARWACVGQGRPVHCKRYKPSRHGPASCVCCGAKAWLDEIGYFITACNCIGADEEFDTQIYLRQDPGWILLETGVSYPEIFEAATRPDDERLLSKKVHLWDKMGLGQ